MKYTIRKCISRNNSNVSRYSRVTMLCYNKM